MKTLYLVRHAKSSWDDESLADLDRPLNGRGRRDAPRMGKRLKERAIVPDLVVTSPANRAITTCLEIIQHLGYPANQILSERKLYHADEEEILQVIHGVDDKHKSLMLFGHNPGLTDFANSLSEKDNLIRNIPTCGIVCFTFQTNTWQSVNPEEGTFVFFDFPKSKED